jgi:hypothetical protein
MKPPVAPTFNDAGLVVFPAVDIGGPAEQFHTQTLNTALRGNRLAYGVTDFTGHVQARHFYLLSADGRVFRCYDNPPAGGDWRRFDFDTAQRDDPGNTGRFAVRGNQLYIKMGGPNSDEPATKISDPNTLEIDTVTYVKK